MNEKKLERIVNSRPLPENVVGYHHKFEVEGTSIYAREVNRETITAIRSAEKKTQADGRTLRTENGKLQIEVDKLAREYQSLDDESMDSETPDERIEEIQLRKAEIDERLEAIENRREEIEDELSEMLETTMGRLKDLAVSHVVAVSWKEGKDEKFDFEPVFETRATLNEISTTLIEKSVLGIGELKNSTRR